MTDAQLAVTVGTLAAAAVVGHVWWLIRIPRAALAATAPKPPAPSRRAAG